MKKIMGLIAGLVLIMQIAVAAEISGQQAMQLLEQGKADEAVAAFEKLTGEGDTRAMVQLGMMYYRGSGVKQDYVKAMDWWMTGFSNQNADAFSNIGVLHRDGQGGAPKNKKMAYCIFLTIHMCGMGSESTQMRANSCLRRLIDELSNDEIKDVLSNYTLGYMDAYIKARGKMDGIPDEYKPSEETPALKDLDWWMDGELDAIFGPPSKEDLEARKKREEERKKAFDEARHTLVYQLKFPGGGEPVYDSHTFVGGMGLSSGPITKTDLKEEDGSLVFEDDEMMLGSPKRFIVVENRGELSLAYEIRHPAKPEPADWSEWAAPDFAFDDGMEVFGLISGQEPKSKAGKVPADAPLMRFKVQK